MAPRCLGERVRGVSAASLFRPLEMKIVNGYHRHNAFYRLCYLDGWFAFRIASSQRRLGIYWRLVLKIPPPRPPLSRQALGEPCLALMLYYRVFSCEKPARSPSSLESIFSI